MSNFEDNLKAVLEESWTDACVVRNTFLTFNDADASADDTPLRRSKSAPAISSPHFLRADHIPSRTYAEVEEQEAALPNARSGLQKQAGPAGAEDPPSGSVSHSPAPDSSLQGTEDDTTEESNSPPEESNSPQDGSAWQPSWSAGAANHIDGDVTRCKPCPWNFKPGGCCLGAMCPQCHLCGALQYKKYRKNRLLGLKAIRAKKKKERADRRAASSSQP